MKEITLVVTFAPVQRWHLPALCAFSTSDVKNRVVLMQCYNFSYHTSI